MSKYKFNNGFIYCNGFRMPMTSVVEALNERDWELSKGKEDYKNLFEAFEDCQKVLGDANKRLENLSRVNKEYKEVLTPIWDYCRENVKVELGKSISEALIESHKLLQSQVWSLEQRCKLLEEDSKDTAKYVEIQRGELAKANERARELENSNARMLHEVANQYDGNDSTEWSIGANHVFRLFAKWISKNEQLRKEQENG